ncbi:Integral membrane protein [Cupriavidus necator]|uniref:Hypothetical membrane spanning protein n=1 Tax=Cupriavidus necator (strain ATCC 17699 / DSM 428 / KCTC 22496 / NCIMB 10442 / H16 / Stanier 337) TaxID=381666 RepID=Q0K009_CUPNH|nr:MULTISPECIES: hypothetical protein [Cupriavidus]EON20774.1 hypothetical protein C265_07379 [Cupriavidus sp. GA3-3]QCC04485.1 hypothetical protein E6A55_28705 [Cupriavidus necator H16]QQB79177.1 hypothetical protein I6H87_28285 [Cupriavidus necator]WKA43398.1 hypothetical protein QWP09_28760 [Cupriavidus necator]CAJ96665.1 hypothetical membrane spanning protein [Cupriavidus necator H16]
MSQQVVIGAAHWIYLSGVAVIVLTMILRANVVVPSIVGTALVVFALTGSPVSALGGVFSASLVAAKELFNIFLVIAFMTALLNALKTLRSDIRMVEPFRVVMKNGHSAFFILAGITYVISLFFWPTPAVPLVSAILLPAAIAAGLPPLAGAMAIAIAGQGMALSSDYVIGVAPGISAKAAGAAVSAAVVADRALALSIITGTIALCLAYLSMRKHIVPACGTLLDRWQARASGSAEALEGGGTFDKAEIARGTAHAEPLASDSNIEASLAMVARRRVKWSKCFAIVTPIAFLAVVAVMVLPKLGTGVQDLKGGDAAALVGGVAAVLMMLATLAAEGPRRMLDVCPEHITDGFVFAFKAMGSVLPIAGFFFVGAGETAAQILGLPPGKAPSLLFELIQAYQHMIPDNHVLVAFGVLLVGMITGIDGSGFAGLPLTGTLAGALGPVVGFDPATLAAVGQMGAVWTGGGTLVAWSSLIAVAGFARVPVLDAVRALLIPVLIGLACSTVAAMVLWS